MSLRFGGCPCCGDTPSGIWHRRHFLKAAGAAMAGVALAPGSAFADAVPTIAYESVPDLIQLPPDMFLGECSGVAVNSKGHLFILSRGNTTGPAYGAAAAQLGSVRADGGKIGTREGVGRGGHRIGDLGWSCDTSS